MSARFGKEDRVFGLTHLKLRPTSRKPYLFLAVLSATWASCLLRRMRSQMTTSFAVWYPVRPVTSVKNRQLAVLLLPRFVSTFFEAILTCLAES